MESIGFKGRAKVKHPSQRAIPGCGQGISSLFRSLPEGKSPFPCEELRILTLS